MKHGVYSQENPTPLLAVKMADSALPFVVGTAPVHTMTGAASVNKAVKLTCWQDVLDTFGYVHDYGRYTLIEFLYAYFRLWGYAPVVAVNEFDPATVTGEGTATSVTLAGGVGTLKTAGALVKWVGSDATGTIKYVEGTDYSLKYDEAGYPIVTRISTGVIASDTAAVFVNHVEITADKCGVLATAIVTGMAEIDTVYEQFGAVPALILAPGYSDDTTVMAAMVGKADGYGSGWFAHALADVDSTSAGADAIADVAGWKSTNGFTSPCLDVCWPKVQIGDDIYHLSSILACALAQTDLENGEVPYTSGSNLSIPISGAVLADGTAVWINQAQANDSLNANGVTTVICNGGAGWVTWGNYTGAYPGSSDAKDIWRNFRRELVWLENTAKLTLMSKVDQPGNYRQIESIINSLNIHLNSLAAQGALVGQPKVEFRPELNPATDLLAGKYTFSISITPPTAMQAIVLEWTVDPSQLNTLFAA